MKILIADPSDILCEALEQQLKCDHDVQICRDGRDLIPLILRHRPDLVILGLELPYMDGLTILRTVNAAGVFARFLVLTNLLNEYVVSTLSQFKMCYALQKPCSVCTVLSRVYDLLHYGEQMHSNIAADLLALGVRMNLGGFACIVHAVQLLRQNPQQSLTKELYPAVAKICGGTSQRVERAIRTAVRDAWMHRNESIWRAYFSVNRQGVISLPSNGDFIARIASVGKDNTACG